MARHVWKEMLYTISIKICSFLLFWPAEKGTYFKFQWNFTKKNREINFETLFSPSFNLLHSSPMVFVNHMEPIFQDLLLYCTKKVPENHNHFFHFRHGGETHFQVLAQTLNYRKHRPRGPMLKKKNITLPSSTVQTKTK